MERIGRWMWTVAGLALALLLSACDGGGGQQVGCVTNDDCDVGQVCVGRNCQYPEDSGVRTCTNELQCFIGERCLDGVCTLVTEEPQEEPDGSSGDGDGEGGDDGAQDDGDGEGGDDGVTPEDQDQRDFSRLNFTLAVRPTGAGGAASVCLDGLHPTANAGPSLPSSTLVNGVTLTGQVRAGGSPLTGARVSVLHARPDCVPPTATTDGSGFSLYLPPGGPYDLQAVAADGRVGYARVANLQGNAAQNIDLPATAALVGGPVYETGVPAVNGWTVQAWYRTGANAGRLAHAGVQNGPPASADGEFSLPLEEGPAYDLLGLPPGISAFPMQLLYEDVCHPGQACASTNLGSARLKDGFSLLGRVSTAAGTGAAGSLLELVKSTDSRLALSPSAGSDGIYSVLLRPGQWLLTVVPSGAAFQQGALVYVVPSQSIVSADVTKNISLGLGEMLTFVGRVTDAQGAGLAGLQVKLLVNEQPMAEGSYTGCDEAWTTTEADGTFRVRCNVAPP
ncbi:MAG TPA: carboxypeptidase-like regulatory domain-containing protein [Myxococcota bacterium]|nr:carboxypeptidase-like regulatory domain-containing protein [Myxococcota bacterium]HRY96468.1 carboxypeptidase-like regulatory domain-containing protein [Myxococcota bacterium]